MRKLTKGDKMKKEQVLVFRDANSGEADEVYYLDRKGEGNRFFANLSNNAERNQVHHIRLEEWTKDQVALADLSGKYYGAVMPAKALSKYKELNKKVKSKDRKWPS